MLNWIIENRAWVFSGIGVTILLLLLGVSRKLWSRVLPHISALLRHVLFMQPSPFPFKDAGISQFHVNCSSIGEDKYWASLIRSATKVVEILGYSLYSTMKNKEFTQQLARLARDPNMCLRILLADPESPIVNERAYSLDMHHALLRHRIYESRDALSSFIDPGSRLLGEIRTFSDILVPYSLLRVDSRMLVMPYLSSMPKRESLAFFIEGKTTEIFQKYQLDFERIWDRSQPLYNQRVFVPSIYVQVCSEKGMIATFVGDYWRNTVSHSGLSGIIKCLDIGCGDGTQSLLTFNNVAQSAGKAHVDVTFLDPSVLAVQAIDNTFITKKQLFATEDIIQKRWQEFSTDQLFDFIFCSHVIGAIYQQVGTDEAFHAELERMLATLKPGGLLCIVTASNLSIESQLRRSKRLAPRENLSSELLESYLKEWNFEYDATELRPFLRLEGWLGNGDEQVNVIENELMRFLFAPQKELTGEVAKAYRLGLRQKAVAWREIEAHDRQDFLRNCRPEVLTQVEDGDLFGKMLHVVFWLHAKNRDSTGRRAGT